MMHGDCVDVADDDDDVDDDGAVVVDGDGL